MCDSAMPLTVELVKVLCIILSYVLQCPINAEIRVADSQADKRPL